MNLTKSNIEHYCFGYCHLFALAIHRELGYEMEFFWNSLPDMQNLNEDEPECLIHAYAVSPIGVKYDAMGKLLDKKIESIYKRIEPNLIRKETEETLDRLMWGGILAIYNDGEIEFIQEHIRNNINLYV